MRIGIFRNEIYEAGGIETWLYNIAVLYSANYDITVYYGPLADENKVRQIAEHTSVELYEGQDVEVDVAVYCYDFMGYDTVTADKSIFMVHSDYAHVHSLNWEVPEGIDEIYAVSEIAAQSAEKILNREVGVLYNPVIQANKPRPMKLVSPTRLTFEKGLKRMKLLARALDDLSVDYVWDIYTPSWDIKPFGKGVRFHKTIPDATEKIAEADYLVQLSDTESFGYSMVEALSMGTGLVCTDIPVLHELGINNYNSIVIGLDSGDYSGAVLRMAASYNYVVPQSDYSVIFGPPSNKPLLHIMNTGPVDVYEYGRWIAPGETVRSSEKPESPYLTIK